MRLKLFDNFVGFLLVITMIVISPVLLILVFLYVIYEILYCGLSTIVEKGKKE